MVEHLTSVVLWDLDGTIQDSESLAKEGTRYGFQQVLGRDPTDDEFAKLIIFTKQFQFTVLFRFQNLGLVVTIKN